MLETFDTKQTYEAFSGHGFTQEQAEVLTEYLHKNYLTTVANLATKDDLKVLATDLKSLATELRAEIKLSEQRMTIKLGGLLVISIGIMTAIQQLLG